MEDLLGATAPREESNSGGTLALFLGLYLLILAFFILLVSISTTESVRAKAVMEGLSSTFSTLMPPSTDPTHFASKEGDFLGAGQEFQEQIASVFATEIQITKVEVVTPGRVMRVVMPADALFQTGKAVLREAQFPLLDKVVAELSRRTPGMRYELEFVIGARFAVGNDLPVGQTLESERAGSMARAMAERGVPPGGVTVALKPGDPKEVVLWFLSRPLEEARVRFDAPPPQPAPAKAVPATAVPVPPPPTSSPPAAKVEMPLPPPPALPAVPTQ